MMGELDHRVKNTLALVLSISNLTLSKEDTLEGFHKSFSGCIQSLAATHNLLADRAWTNLTVADVIRTELAPFISLESSRVQFEHLDTGITPRAAIALGMTIHELATNAVKYGALSTEKGKLRLHAELGTESLKLDWIESDGPLVNEPRRKGFGRTVIGRSLQYSPNGGADLRGAAFERRDKSLAVISMIIFFSTSIMRLHQARQADDWITIMPSFREGISSLTF